MKDDPIKFVQAMELLKAAEDSHGEAAHLTNNADLAHNHGRCAEAAQVAGDAVFNYVNACASYLDDGEAKVVLAEHLKPDPAPAQ